MTHTLRTVSTSATRAALVFLALVAVAAGAATVATAHYSATPATVVASEAPAPVSYSEEHPLFDCRIDGNRVCGPDAVVPVPVAGGVTYMHHALAPAPDRVAAPIVWTLPGR